MNMLKSLPVLSLLVAAPLSLDVKAAPVSGAYVEDEQRFFVEGQPLTDAIESASSIICYMAAMRPDAFVNDGSYVAKIYEDRCETTGANATSEKASATATSSQSSTTASSSTSSTSIETEQALEAVLDVTLGKQGDPVIAKVWVDNKAQSDEDIDTQIYVLVNQTAGVSETAPNGEFEMWFSAHLDGDADIFGKFAGPGDSGTGGELPDGGTDGGEFPEGSADGGGDGFPDEGPDFEIVDGLAVSQGYLKTSGTELQFKEFGFGYESDIAMDFIENGDIDGIYGQFLGLCTGCEPPEPGYSGPPVEPEFRNITAFYQFYVNKTNATYCRNLLSAFELCFSQSETGTCANYVAPDAESDSYNSFEPVRVELTNAELAQLVEDSGTTSLSLEEECYSLARGDATRNVFRYGVYEADGSRLAVGQTGAFPMFANVEVEISTPTESEPNKTTTVQERVFAFADYWGVFIDPRGRSLITKSDQDLNDVVFKKEVFGPGSSTSDGTGFRVAQSEVRVEKRSKSYSSLNDLDKIRIGLYVQDSFWSAEYKALLGLERDDSLFNWNPTGEDNFIAEELQGAFESATYLPEDLDDGVPKAGAEPGVFVFDTAVSFMQGWQEVSLPTKIYFKPSDWTSKMRKEETFFGPDGPETFSDVRPMGVWSNDTFQWYDISAAALSDPTLAAPAAGCPADIFSLPPEDACRGGIRTETSEFISPDALPDGDPLVCIRDCLSPAAMQQTFGYAYCKQNPDADGCSGVDTSSQFAPSPFAGVGPYLKNSVTVIEPFSDFQALGMTDGFYLKNNTLLREGFRLASSRAQVVDYILVRSGEEEGIEEDQSVARYLSMDGQGKNNEFTGAGVLALATYDSLNYNNLSELISGTGGKAPIVTFDLMSVPEVGESGTVDVMVKLNNQTTGTSLMATVPVVWSSTEQGFSLTVPAGVNYEVKLLTESVGLEIESGTAILSNSQDDVFAYGGGLLSNGGRAALTTRLLSLFGGDQGDISSLNLGGFIQQGAEYELRVQFTPVGVSSEETGFFGEGPIPDPGPGLDLDTLAISFRVQDEGEFQYFTGAFEQGQYWDGIRDSEAVRYTATANGFTVGGEPLSKGEAINTYLSNSPDPYSAFGNVQYQRPDGWSDNLSWGLRTGELVLESDLADLECRKVENDRYEDHPAFSGEEETETRYCEQKLFESVALTTYQIQVEVQPSYILLDANSGEAVTISPPRTLYYEVPDDEAVYGRDAGKRLSLEYAGHGELRGIPGFIYDTATGEELGQFTREWKDTYRFINRFNIPDGGVVTDADDVEYFVKALDGEEWLKKFGEGDAPITEAGNYTFSRDRLVPNNKLRILGEPEGPHEAEYIGEAPTAACDGTTTENCLIFSGEPAVVHGEVVSGADPTPAGE